MELKDLVNGYLINNEISDVKVTAIDESKESLLVTFVCDDDESTEDDIIVSGLDDVDYDLILYSPEEYKVLVIVLELCKYLDIEIVDIDWNNDVEDVIEYLTKEEM